MKKKFEKHYLFWIDAKYKDIMNKETREMIENELQKKYNFNYVPFSDLDKAIEELKKIGMETVFVLVSGRFYQDYFLTIKKIRNDLTCFPVTLVYTSTSFKKILLREEKDDKKVIKKETFDSIGDKYYNWGGVADTPQDIKTFLGKYLNIKKLIEPSKDIKASSKFQITEEFSIELIEKYEDLILPSIYTKAESEDNKSSDIVKSSTKFNEKLNNIFSNEIHDLNKFQLQELTKYWINLYTRESDFYKTMNYEFLKNDFSNYNVFPKSLYKGLEKGYLKSEFNVPLYFGTTLDEKQFEALKKIKKSNNELNAALFYSKKILSFSKDINVSYSFVNNNYENSIIFETNISGIKKYSDILSYNVDITNFSYFQAEKEVDFLPFSCFLIEGGIEERKIDNHNCKIVKLNYLGKYIDKINSKLEDLNEFNIEKILKNEKTKFIKDINEKYKKNEGKNDKGNYGLIKKLLLGSKLLIHRTLEKSKLNIQIENTIEIKLLNQGKYMNQDYFNRYKNLFSVYYDDTLQNNPSNEIRDHLPNKIIIKFKNIIIDCEEMFADCTSLREINFINFEINAVTSMAYMFSDCAFLKKVNFNNFNTRNVVDMKEMFCGCISLIELHVNNFDTRKVINMSGMFWKCEKIKNLNLSNFNNSNVENMSAMFKGCTELQELQFDLKNAHNLRDISYMFKGDNNLSFKIYDFNNNLIQYREGFF